MLAGVEWVLFDAVGTLIYPDPPVAEAYHSAGLRLGSRLGVDEIRRRFAAAFIAGHVRGGPTSEALERERWRVIVADVFHDVANEAEVLFESLWQQFADPGQWRTYDDVAALVELSDHGYQLGIASNFDRRLDNIVRAHPTLASCNPVFVSSSLGYTKPDLRFFRAIEEQLDVDSSKIALVGDDEIHDVQGAIVAGWRAIHLDRNRSRPAAGEIQSLWNLL